MSTVETNPCTMTGEEIVISGISGLFPNSSNVLEFMDNLYNKIDMVPSEEQFWNFQHPDLPQHLGKVKGTNLFDTHFFRIPHHQVPYMEPMGRKLLEQVNAAIFDAGVNPLTLAGSKIGVFIGSSCTDTCHLNLYDDSKNTGYIITGFPKNMLANRISYCLDCKCTSFTLNSTCSSSAACLNKAYWSILKGYCDTAVVGGCNECLHPMLSINMKRAGLLCMDGKTKCFDKNGDGYVRSEACSVVFLQKAKHAKRIYLEVHYALEKYFAGPGDDFLPNRRPQDVVAFLEEFYARANVSPNDVEYVEASASGIAIADGNELEAIGRFFGKHKTVKVGCVKSNMGHSESASGICAVTKVCLAHHTGKIPANLHYNDPQSHIPAVRDGKVKVLTENFSFNRGYVALNSFSNSGVNVHVLMKGHYKQKNKDQYKSSLVRLIVASGRTESSLWKLFEYLKKAPVDPEQIALLHDIFSREIPSHMARGYLIVGERNKTITVAESIKFYSSSKRPVCFMYSGMGSQWPGMGTELMCIPTFAAAIQRCHKILKPKGVDIIKILTTMNAQIFDSILNSFVGIAAVQIGLTDVLKEMGIVPDIIIGHSVGELGCAYADEAFTAEEMILLSYCRGLVSKQTTFIRGSMASIGLGYTKIQEICPPEIEVACHNSFESSTISGPVDAIKRFVEKLTRDGIFAKEVNTSNIAYHSKYIAEAGPKLLSLMKKYIVTPKLRSRKWLSTSVLPENWHLPESKYSSAKYFTDNLLNPVYFEEVASKEIPANAILIEIAPHGLMQAILRRSHKDCIHIPLTRRKNADPVKFFLKSIGLLYEAGLNPKIDVLYPKVQFPVSTETPILSHVVEWEHGIEWPTPGFRKEERVITPCREVTISIHDDDWDFIKGYTRNGFNLIPESALLVLVWQTLSIYKGVDYREMSVVFHNVKFHREVNAVAKDLVKLYICIQKQEGLQEFEICFEGAMVASGYIEITKDTPLDVSKIVNINESTMELNLKDVYSILSMRGLSYGNKFRCIHSCNMNYDRVYINWTGEWITFIDCVIQMIILGQDCDGPSSPKYIKEIIIDTSQHTTASYVYVGARGTPKGSYQYNNVYQCGGVQIRSPIFNNLHEEPELKQTPITKNIECPTFENILLTSTTPGDLEKLVWVESTKSIFSFSHSLANDRAATIVKISYAGISLRDCEKAVGFVNQQEPFGMDFSGIDEKGERVMGVVYGGALATKVEADPDLLWPVPNHWSMEEAATVPLPYLLAYYCLVSVFRIPFNEISKQVSFGLFFHSTSHRNWNEMILKNITTVARKTNKYFCNKITKSLHHYSLKIVS